LGGKSGESGHSSAWESSARGEGEGDRFDETNNALLGCRRSGVKVIERKDARILKRASGELPSAEGKIGAKLKPPHVVATQRHLPSPKENSLRIGPGGEIQHILRDKGGLAQV